MSQTSDTSYKAKTYQNRDRLRRFSHRSRFDLAASFVDIPENGRVLDFGGGDGAFMSLLRKRSQNPFDAVLFEPFMDMDIAPDPSITHVADWEKVKDLAEHRKFDVVFCLEVMEHFSAPRQDEALARIASVMASNGTLVVSVPVELGPVALLKNVGRWKYRKGGTGIYNYPNLFRSFFGLPIPSARSGNEYLTHMGFYFNDLRKILEQRFVIETITASPFRMLPAICNSQVFFKCRPKV